MFTFKEIDRQIKNYEEELKFWYNVLKNMNPKEYDKVFSSDGFHKNKVEFFCFVSASFIDILCSYRNLKRAKSNWEKTYNLKIIYMTVYETINTYHKYKGQIYKQLKEDNIEKFDLFFDMLNRELSDFKKQYKFDTIMPKIRNKFAAHYDKNFIDYYSNIELLDKINTKELVPDFLHFINPLHYFAFSWLKGEINELQFLDSWLR